MFDSKRMSIYEVLISLLIVTSLSLFDIKFIFLGIQAISIFFTLPQIINDSDKARFINYLLWAVIFVPYSFLSFLWAGARNHTVISSALSIVQVILIGVCVLCFCTTMERVIIAIRAFVISGIVLCVRFFCTVPVELWAQGERFSADSIFGKNMAAIVLSYASILLLFICVCTDYEKKHKLICVILITMFLFVAMMMGTRKSLLIFLMGLLIMILSKAQNVVSVLVRIILCVGIVWGAYKLVLNVPVLYNSIGYRFASFFNGVLGGETDRSTMSRALFISDALHVFKENWFVGIGLDGYRYVNPYEIAYSHCNYSEMLANLGIIGFGIFYSLHIKMLVDSIKVRKYNVLPLALLIISLAVDFMAVTYSGECFNVVMALTIGIINISKENNPDDLEQEDEPNNIFDTMEGTNEQQFHEI